jgi:hypothetical protein
MLSLKVGIDSRAHFAVYGYVRLPFAVSSRWFEGDREIQTSALDQRKKGRDHSIFPSRSKKRTPILMA